MRDPRPECRPGDVHASPESPMNPLRPYRRMAVTALAVLALAACQTTPEAPSGATGAPRAQQHKATPGVPAPLADVAARALTDTLSVMGMNLADTARAGDVLQASADATSPIIAFFMV